MFRTAIVAIAAVSAIAAAISGAAAAQAASPVRKLAAPTAAGQWAVVREGDRTISHCVMGLRSDAPAPDAGQPQFMFSADSEFVLLRVRAAEWSFDRSRDIPVLMVTADGSERRPAAAVHGADLIDISFGVAPELMTGLAASGHLDIEAEGTKIRLPLKGLTEVLPDYRNCLASIGQPKTGWHASAALDAR